MVNIGLEGQMLLGTWGAAYFTYWYGPWAGLVGRGGHGCPRRPAARLATITFGVDHIVSGVAINIIALGVTQYLAEAYFTDLQNGGPRQLTGLDPLPYVTVPGAVRRADDAERAALVRGLRRRGLLRGADHEGLGDDDHHRDHRRADGLAAVAHVVRAAAAVVR